MHHEEDIPCGRGLKRKAVEPPQSHKMIEKRRRDRINNSLIELSHAVPAAFSKQSSGKLEKAEILEMTVHYLRAIQTTEIGTRFENGDWYSSDIWADFIHHYQSGYSDCMGELFRYFQQVEGLDADDSRVVRALSFLQSRYKPDSSVSNGSAYRRQPTRPLNRDDNLNSNKLHQDESNMAPQSHRDLPMTNPLPILNVEPKANDNLKMNFHANSTIQRHYGQSNSVVHDNLNSHTAPMVQIPKTDQIFLPQIQKSDCNLVRSMSVFKQSAFPYERCLRM